jgi:late competence protein required for DNA uptake (superfamily II DNA/RNA helicase)
MSKPVTVNIGDRCTHCGRNTSFGAVDDNGEQLLLFVNRIPSGADGMLVFANGVTAEESGTIVTLEGWMCIECQSSVECDRCGELTVDYEILDLPIPELLCENCLEKHNASKKGESK